MGDEGKLDIFSKYLTVWVAVAILLGTGIGYFFPAFAATLGSFEVAKVSIPVAFVLLFMMYPIMLSLDFREILSVRNNPKPVVLTVLINWAIKPFTMAAIAWLFMRVIFAPYIPVALQTEYIAGMILLGIAPCTAMVLMWTHLAKANVNHALVQVTVNDLIILVLFAPIGKFLLGVTTDFPVPFATIFYSVLFYVALPLGLAVISRAFLLRKNGREWFDHRFCPCLNGLTQLGLLVTLVLLFMFQGDKIIRYPWHILLIAIPLILQTYLIFGIGYFGAKKARIRYTEAAPATMIGASNFFELSIAVALILFGMNSGAALATVVGVLVEVPVMLSLVGIMKAKRKEFPG